MVAGQVRGELLHRLRRCLLQRRGPRRPFVLEDGRANGQRNEVHRLVEALELALHKLQLEAGDILLGRFLERRRARLGWGGPSEWVGLLSLVLRSNFARASRHEGLHGCRRRRLLRLCIRLNSHRLDLVVDVDFVDCRRRRRKDS